jgi:cation transport regulator ChaC
MNGQKSQQCTELGLCLVLRLTTKAYTAVKFTRTANVTRNDGRYRMCAVYLPHPHESEILTKKWREAQKAIIA